MIKSLIRVLLLILLFSLFDALIGGGIAASMQTKGAWNQLVNDFYQLGFSIGMAVVLLVCYGVLNWRSEAAAVLVMLFGYVEDMLYYVFVPIVNPIIKFITHGSEYRVLGGGMFPTHIAGWLGWVGRVSEWGTWKLSFPVIIVVNFFAFIVAMGILIYYSSRFSSDE